MTLSQTLFPSQSLLVKGLMVLAGSAFIALAAQVSVPMIPVPMTLQTLAVLIVGLSFGSRLGALTVAAYLAEGAVGLPVFAGGASAAALVGPTAGFLYGFVAMAFLAGLAADRGVKGLGPTALVALAASTALVALAASAALYLPGVAWAMLADSALGFDASTWGADTFAMIWAYYMAPFLIGDAVKAVIAALVVTGGWAAMARRKG